MTFFLSEQQAAYALKIIAASSDVAVSLTLWALDVGTGRLIRLRRLHRHIPQHFIWAEDHEAPELGERRENSPIWCGVQCFSGEHMKGQLSGAIRLRATPGKR